MAQVVSNPGRIPKPVESQLAALRRKIVTWFLVDGLSKVLLVVCVAGALDFLLDWQFHMDFAQRAIMLVLMVAAIIAAGACWLVRPFQRRPGDDSLCLEVERSHRELQESLISSVQFSRMSHDQLDGVSPAMVQATIQHGVEASRKINFSNVLNAPRFRSNAALLTSALAVICLAGYAVAATEPGRIWFNRNILLGTMTWPQDVYLEVEGIGEDRTLRLVRGDNWIQHVRVLPTSEYVPDKVYIERRTGNSELMNRLHDNKKRRANQMGTPDKPADPPAPDAESDGVLARFELKVLNVNDEFEFRARGGDDETDWVKVELVDPPMLTQLELEVAPPEYMQQPTEKLPAGQGPYYVFTGSQLTVSGTSNKPIAQAVLKVRGTATQWTMEQTSPTSVAVVVPYGELVDGKYEIQLVDESGLTAKRPTAFGIRLKLDQAPRVPSFRLHGIARLVVPNARIPLAAQILDDFAVTNVALGFELRGELGDLTKATGEVDFPSVADQLGGKDVLLDDIWELNTLDLPTGITLTMRIHGKDNDVVTPDKQPGKSKERLLRVVTEEELRTDLLRREKEMREELSRLLELQEQVLTDCRALRAELGDEPNLTAKQKGTLLGIRRQQTLLGNNIESVADRLDDFILEVLNNRLEDEGGPLQDRLLTKVVRPLRSAVEVENHDALISLDLARQAEDQPAERNPALQAAADDQAKIVDVLREVLVHMVKAEGYQEAVNALYQIEKAEKGVFDATKKSWQDLIKRLLEEGKIDPPAEQPK